LMLPPTKLWSEQKMCLKEIVLRVKCILRERLSW
jgi:hypothetical protein